MMQFYRMAAVVAMLWVLSVSGAAEEMTAQERAQEVFRAQFKLIVNGEANRAVYGSFAASVKRESDRYQMALEVAETKGKVKQIEQLKEILAWYDQQQSLIKKMATLEVEIATLASSSETANQQKADLLRADLRSMGSDFKNLRENPPTRGR